ncbi:MAG: hypothetical protein E7292_00520 [Lachnospiraceae bacterium]|nr:hypothetical protein [Lachnospiraceae bacterium]
MVKKYFDKRVFVIFALIGFAFGFFQLTGWELAEKGNILWTGAYIARLSFLCLAVGVFAGAVSCVLPVVLAGKLSLIRTEELSTPEGKSSIWYSEGVRWFVSFGLIVLSWLPCYLAYYPGICAYDTTIQLGQVESGAYNDHHPIAHTLLLDGFMSLGDKLFNDVNTGLALLVLFQMLALAAVLAWGIVLLTDRGVTKWIPVCLQIGSMIYPFHMYMSVSVCKDVLFTVFFLLQMLALYEMIRRRTSGLDRYDVLFAVSSVGMQLYRNNGRYAMLVLVVILFVAVIGGKGARRFWGKIAVNCAFSLVVGSLCISGLFRLTGAEQGDRREMLSMPIQQLARCMVYHGGVGVLAEDDATMDEDSKALINDFLLNESYKEYRPDIADPVKRHTNTYVVRYRTEEFAGTYLNLLGRYPGDFINAALAVNAGYFYVGDESHAYINVNGRDTGLGYVQTRFLTEELNSRGVYQDSKWKSLFRIMEKWADNNAYLKLPVLKYLFVPGVFLWLYMLLAGCLIACRKYDRCVPLALVMGYYATLILGPTVQLRYIYPLMVVLPFSVLMAICRGGSKETKNEQSE